MQDKDEAFDWERLLLVAIIAGGAGLLLLPFYCAYFHWIFSKLT